MEEGAKNSGGDINTENSNINVVISDAAPISEGAVLTYAVTLSQTVPTDTHIPLTYSGTANPILDYDNQPITVIIPANQSSATVSVPTLIDNMAGNSDTVVVALGTPDNPEIHVLIIDDIGFY